MKHGKIIDVLIVGAGPTGTTLAIDLARRGLELRIIDKAPMAFDGSRAKGIQPRSLEVFADLEVLDDILAAGSLYPKLGVHLGPFSLPWRMFRNIAATPSVPHPNTWLIPQYRVDGALHARLGKLGHHAQFGHELLDLAQDSDTITATISTANGPEEITARYLVGADGGSSAVRKKLGIAFSGTTREQDRMLIVDATTTGLPRDRWHVWPRLGGKFIGACPLPHTDMFQWIIRLAPDEEAPRDLAGIMQRIHAHTGKPHISLRDIQWQSVFRPNIRMAEHYRAGRALLAGDAAHVHTPAGAQGLNTGIQDAYNLGWKLAQCIAGADDTLLDSYEAERQPIAARVLGLSTKKYDAIGTLNPSAIKRGKDEQQLALTYQGGPLALAGNRTTTLQAGDRAPDAILRDNKGDEVRLFDSFKGPHFTAIAYGLAAANELAHLDWPSLGAPLQRVAINAPANTTGHALIDATHTFRDAYGVTGATLLLVRPDGYLAHIATQDMLATTQAAIRCLTPTAESHENERHK
jgi:2-polyprenyl-6-methoxyphenol hydroxylase-like FAD-dependent oxidoreductase